MIHLTCKSHLYHNSQKDFSVFIILDNLISTIKPFVVKNNTKKQIFDHL